jgi:hypothetical protein
MFVTVSIGGNIGEEPMPIDEWLAFRHRTRSACEAVGEVVGESSGYSRWGDVVEKTYKVDVFLDDATFGIRRGALAEALSTLAGIFEQDGIGISFGTVVKATAE